MDLHASFRRAEMLVASSRPLDALQALAPVLENQPTTPRCSCSPAGRTSTRPS
jgi:hypothetical protein